MYVALEEAEDESRFGGKASNLARCLRAGLPVPPGVAFAWDAADRLHADDVAAFLAPLLACVGDLLAVRSSAVGEDSASASFAGQHATALGIRSAEGLAAAVREVHASARSDAALGYRTKLGLDREPRMGVVVQALIRADVAGVLFTRDPLSGADVRVVEASWGLGEAVVEGLVTPDRYVMARGGEVLVSEAGEKDVAVRWSTRGGTEEVEVSPLLARTLCLEADALLALDALALRCEEVFGGAQDLEFAFAGGQLHLLQRRAVTRLG